MVANRGIPITVVENMGPRGGQLTARVLAPECLACGSVSGGSRIQEHSMGSKQSLQGAKCVLNVGEYLRLEIKRLGLNQTTLSAAISVSRQSINNIIKGRQPVSRKMARKLARVTGRRADYWLRSEYPAPREQRPSTRLAKTSEVKPEKRRRRPWEWRSAKSPSFRDFILKISHHDASSKKFVKEIKADLEFPSVDTWADLRFHLYRLGASDEHFVAARALWRKYV
ncbi:MAG: hypothetical protein JWR80_7435 [Bradyrhizobium sp.]|nr:hypothetical protein [Bradyrhizobium sp.]